MTIKKNSKKALELIQLATWQIAIVVVFIVLLILSGVVVVSSSEVRTKVVSATEKFVKYTFLKEVEVVINNDLDLVKLGIYHDFESDNSEVFPEIERGNGKAELKLYPGIYKFRFKRDGYKIISKRVVVVSNKGPIEINLKFDELDIVKEKVEDEEIVEDEIDELEIELPVDESSEITVSSNDSEVVTKEEPPRLPDYRIRWSEFVNPSNGRQILWGSRVVESQIEEVDINFYVQNNGEIESQAVEVVITIQGNDSEGNVYEVREVISGLPLGLDRKVSINNFILKAGVEYTIKATIDPGGEIDELDESNNIRVGSIRYK